MACRGASTAILTVALVVGLLLGLAQPAVAAGITVSRAELKGGQLRVEGGGAVANAAISIDGVARGTANGAGAFKIQVSGFSSPTCTIVVSDGSTSTTATLTGCTPSAPPPAALSSLVLSPTGVVGGGTSQGTVTLTSAAPTGGAAVSLSSSNTAVATVPASVTVAAGGTTASFSIATVSVTVSTSVTISASFGGVTKTAILTVTPPMPPAPTPLAPATGASVLVPFAISWSAVLDPNALNGGYNWQVSPASTITPVILRDSTNPATTQDTVSGLTNGIYFWRVQAADGAGQQSAWSEARSFTVTGVGPGTPGTPVLAPTRGYSTFHPEEVIHFDWSAVPDAVTYRLEVANDPSFPLDTVFPAFHTFWNDNIPTNTDGFRWGRSLGEGTFLARVFAVSANNPQEGIRSLPSNVITFTVFFNNPIGPPPVLLSPINGETLTLPITLTWAHVPNPQPSGYHGQISSDPSFSTNEAPLFVQLTEPRFHILSLTPGTKFWRVASTQGLASFDPQTGASTNAVTAWSATGTFAISTAPPTPVSIALEGVPLPQTVYSGVDRWVAVQLTAGVPASGATIALASSDPVAAPVPQTIMMPGTHAWTQFQMQAGQVTVPTLVTLTATLNGASASGQFTVLPPSLKSLSMPSTVSGGAQAGAIVMLNGQAPAGGAVVSLSSNSPAASPPSTATVAPGSFSVSVPIPTSTVTTNTAATITASWNGVSATAQITLTPQLPPTSLTLNPTSTIGTGGSSFGTVTIASPAPSDEILQLTSSNPAVARVNNGVMIPAGMTTGGFNIFTTSVTVQTLVTISVSGGGVTKSATLTVNPDPPPLPPPPADTVSVTRCEYDTAKKTLRIEATSTSSSATLTVVVSSSGEMIGTLTNNGGGKYSGQLNWSVNPQNVTVKSSLGGSGSCSVSAK